MFSIDIDQCCRFSYSYSMKCICSLLLHNQPTDFLISSFIIFTILAAADSSLLFSFFVQHHSRVCWFFPSAFKLWWFLPFWIGLLLANLVETWNQNKGNELFHHPPSAIASVPVIFLSFTCGKFFARLYSLFSLLFNFFLLLFMYCYGYTANAWTDAVVDIQITTKIDFFVIIIRQDHS